MILILVNPVCSMHHGTQFTLTHPVNIGLNGSMKIGVLVVHIVVPNTLGNKYNSRSSFERTWRKSSGTNFGVII